MDNHEPHRKKNWISDIILGGQDGIVSILGLLLGLSAATHSTKIIIAGGLATIIAETLSMGAVAYTSKMADRDHYAAERIKEFKEIEEVPEVEKKEIVDIYRSKGFSGKLLDEIVDHITSNKELWVNTMMREELEIMPIIKKDVYIYSLTVGSSALGGGLMPLIPFFILPVHISLIISLIASILILGAVGAYKARMTSTNVLKSSLEMILIGMGAAIAGYLIGLIFKA